jgi:hypothetical protein
VTDPAAQEPWVRWLAYLHPAWMSVSLGVATLALRRGLALRRARRLGRSRSAAELRGHLRAAKPAVVMLALGFVGGPLSMLWLRGREPFGTVHSAIGTSALALFVATAWFGLRLERGRGGSRDAHALVALLAALAGGLAAITGFVLLP